MHTFFLRLYKFFPTAHIFTTAHIFASIPGWLQHSVGGNICPSRCPRKNKTRHKKQISLFRSYNPHTKSIMQNNIRHDFIVSTDVNTNYEKLCICFYQTKKAWSKQNKPLSNNWISFLNTLQGKTLIQSLFGHGHTRLFFTAFEDTISRRYILASKYSAI